METVNYKDVDGTELMKLIKANKKVRVTDLTSVKSAVEWVESVIENGGNSCRIYTSKRSAAMGGMLVSGVSSLIGVGSAIGIAAHRVATYNPDFEVEKRYYDNQLIIHNKKF